MIIFMIIISVPVNRVERATCNYSLLWDFGNYLFFFSQKSAGEISNCLTIE